MRNAETACSVDDFAYQELWYRQHRISRAVDSCCCCCCCIRVRSSLFPGNWWLADTVPVYPPQFELNNSAQGAACSAAGIHALNRPSHAPEMAVRRQKAHRSGNPCPNTTASFRQYNAHIRTNAPTYQYDGVYYLWFCCTWKEHIAANASKQG